MPSFQYRKSASIKSTIPMKAYTSYSSYQEEDVRFLQRSLFTQYYNFDKRVKFCQYIRKKLKDENNEACLQAVEISDNSGIVIFDGYKIHDNIYLQKQIGSNSKHGVIFKAFVKNVFGGEPIAAKLMKYTLNNEKELKINELVSDKILIAKLSPHFLFTYKSFQCHLPENNDLRSLSGLQSIIDNSYYICLNELAHGDLKTLLLDDTVMSNNYLVCNIACQCFLSIATFHKMGYVHRDCHAGNFLYHKCSHVNGYFHYIINSKDYYLQNYGYNIYIYDFGLARYYDEHKINENTMPYFVKDYCRILHAFISKSCGGWSIYDNWPEKKLSMSMAKMIKFMSNKADRLCYICEDDVIIDMIHLLRRMLLDTLPSGATILNETPYIIDNSLRVV